jgi:hypothetical protein
VFELLSGLTIFPTYNIQVGLNKGTRLTRARRDTVEYCIGT